MKKTLLFLATALIFSAVFAQEAELQEDIQNEFSAPQDEKSTSPLPFDFVLQFEPALYLNTESTLVSAPSPIVYPISFGLLWPNYSKIAIQPTLSFFILSGASL